MYIQTSTHTYIQSFDVGANLFIGNLDNDVDEKLLYDTFSAFGVIVGNTPKVMRDPDSGTLLFAHVYAWCFEMHL